MTRPKAKCTFYALLQFVAVFIITRQKILYLMRYFHLKLHQFCIFDAISSEKAGFIMTRPKCAYFMHYYVEKQVFS